MRDVMGKRMQMKDVMGKRMQTIKVKDYDDDWINRLAVIGNRFEAMESEEERRAALDFFIAKYGSDQ